MNKTEEKKLRKTEALKLLSKNLSPKYIAQKLGVHVCTIYRYKQENYDSENQDRLSSKIEEIIKSATSETHIRVMLHTSLTYKQVCSIYRYYKSYIGYGHNKETKINQIAKFLTKFRALKIGPSKDKSAIKRAFYRQARKCHPDLNKNLNKSGTEFQELYNSYQQILNSLF